VDKKPEQIPGALAEINAHAAGNGSDYISKGCWIAAQYAGANLRRTQMRNVGDHEGSVGQVFVGVDMLDWIRKNFRAAPGKKLQMHQLGGAMVGLGGGVPLPPPEGNPRTFILSESSMAVGLVRTPTGHHCASIQITQLEMSMSVRRNEKVTAPFSRVQLSIIARCEDFPEPLLPWAQIKPAFCIDSVAVPRGWEHSVGYYVEGGIDRLVIPRTYVWGHSEPGILGRRRRTGHRSQ
jgi:hypothetical protein